MYVVAASFASQEAAFSRVRARPDLVVLFSTIPQTFSSLVAARTETSHLLLNSRMTRGYLNWATFLLAG
jgi:hypothetical protein